jgi:FkbM family methyltransferase
MISSNKPFINIPDFLYNIYDISKLSFFKKLILIIYGKIVQIFFEKTTKKSFCFFMNLLIPQYSDIHFKNGFYYKKLTPKLSIFYPNKRISRVIKPKEGMFDLMFNSYCLDTLEFTSDDVIIDCGANIGELNYSLFFKGLQVNYIGFEPDPIFYKCLIKNSISGKEIYFNSALSNKVTNEKLYISSEGADSSLIYFGKEEYELITTSTLDSIKLPDKIKLFKVEAEGFEPEVIQGSLKTLKKIEFVSVDFGPERGIEGKSTIIEVNNLLVENNFELVELSSMRLIGLYKNKNL